MLKCHDKTINENLLQDPCDTNNSVMDDMSVDECVGTLEKKTQNMTLAQVTPDTVYLHCTFNKKNICICLNRGETCYTGIPLTNIS